MVIRSLGAMWTMLTFAKSFGTHARWLADDQVQCKFLFVIDPSSAAIVVVATYCWNNNADTTLCTFLFYDTYLTCAPLYSE